MNDFEESDDSVIILGSSENMQALEKEAICRPQKIKYQLHSRKHIERMIEQYFKYKNVTIKKERVALQEVKKNLKKIIAVYNEEHDEKVPILFRESVRD